MRAVFVLPTVIAHVNNKVCMHDSTIAFFQLLDVEAHGSASVLVRAAPSSKTPYMCMTLRIAQRR